MLDIKNKFDFSNIKVIGFDLDQTLYPKSPEIDHAIQEYLYREIGILKNVDLVEAKKMFDELYQNGKGLSGSKTLMKIGFQEEKARNLVQEALENADISKYLQPNKSVLDLLKRLKEKYESIDILTGSNKKNTFIKLEKLKIPKDLFSYILTADDASKSDLSLYKMWMDFYPEKLSENFLYIGDRPSSDILKPKELGIRGILVNIKQTDSLYDCLQLTSLGELDKYI